MKKIFFLIATLVILGCNNGDPEKNPFRRDCYKVIEKIDSDQFDKAGPIAKKISDYSNNYSVSVMEEAFNDISRLFSQIGNAYKEKRRLKEAEPFLEESLKLDERACGIDSPHIVHSLNNLAELYDFQNNNVKALLLYDRILKIQEKKGDPLDISKALNDIAALHKKRHEFSKAEENYKNSLELLKHSPLEKLSTLNALGDFYAHLGNYLDSEATYLEALKTLKGETDTIYRPEMVVTLCKLADVHRLQGHYERSKARYEEALAFAKQHGLEQDIPVIQNYLGWFHASLGNYKIANDLFEEALKYYKDNKKNFSPNQIHKHQASIYNHLGNLCNYQKRYEQANKHYAEALKNQREVLPADNLSSAAIKANMAWLAMNREQYDTAEKLYNDVLDVRREELGNEHSKTAVALNDLGELYTKKKKKEQEKDYKQAEEWLKKAIEIKIESLQDPNHPDVATSINALGELYALKGCPYEARDEFSKAVDIFEARHKSIDSGTRYYNNRAIQNKKLRFSQEAILDLKQAINLSLQGRTNTSGSDEDRAKTFETYYHLFEQMVDWQYDFLCNNEPFYKVTEVYKAMECSRGQGLQDLIESRKIDPLEGISPEIADSLRKEEEQAQSDVSSYAKQLEMLPTRNDYTKKKKEQEKQKLEKNLAHARDRLRQINEKIKNKNPKYRDLFGKGRKPVPFWEMKEQLDLDQCLAFEYLIGTEKSYVLIYGFECEPILLPLQLDENQAKRLGVGLGPLTKDKIRSIFQNEKQDGVLQLAGNHELAKKEDENHNKQLYEKLALLWPILVPDSRIRNRMIGEKNVDPDKKLNCLLFLPDGPLCSFPFEMLVVNDRSDDPHFLLDEGPPTFYAPSAGIYFKLTGRSTNNRIKKVFTVGDPVYRHSQSFGKLKAIQPFASKGIEKSCKKRELEFCSLLQKEVTKKNVQSQIAKHHLVHLNCHGHVKHEYGHFFGGLILSLAENEDDALLELKDIFELDLNSSEIAILDACDTNQGPTQQGEGTWSISRGFLVAGSPRVVMTNWQAVHPVSSDFVVNYVENILDKNENPSAFSYSEGLRQEKLKIRCHRRHPFFWATFALVGLP